MESNSNNNFEIDRPKHRAGFSAWGLVVMAALAVCGAAGSAAVQAQSTVGRVFGWAPAGQTITAQSTAGVHRHSKAKANGRYTIGSLPMGVYTVTLEKDGKAVDTRSNIKLTVGGGAEVDFACAPGQCEESTNN
jgi:hypothetical protein